MIWLVKSFKMTQETQSPYSVHRRGSPFQMSKLVRMGRDGAEWQTINGLTQAGDTVQPQRMCLAYLEPLQTLEPWDPCPRQRTHKQFSTKQSWVKEREAGTGGHIFLNVRRGTELRHMLGPQRAHTYLVQGLHLSVDEKTSEKKPRRQGVHTVSMLSRTVRYTHKNQRIKSRRHLGTGQDGAPDALPHRPGSAWLPVSPAISSRVEEVFAELR